MHLKSTGNDITHSSQVNSPRRLMKQSAFESPTNDVQMNATNAGSGFITAAGKDSILTQRQRLRKTGPFVVHSQSIPDSRTKYAGSWAPPAYESDNENNHVHGPHGPHVIGQKQVFQKRILIHFWFPTNLKYTLRFHKLIQPKRIKSVTVALIVVLK